jgi:hypothetical protein
VVSLSVISCTSGGVVPHLPRNAAPDSYGRNGNGPDLAIEAGRRVACRHVPRLERRRSWPKRISQRYSPRAHDVTDEPVGHLELFTRLLRDGQWWLGSLVAAVALARGQALSTGSTAQANTAA